jgi:superfamily II DNA or RNA helicase
MSTAAGKTVLFSNIIAEHQGRSIAIAHRVELVSQISLTLARHGIRHNILAQPASVRNIVAIHMRELRKSYYSPLALCCVAGVDTLLRMDEPWFKQVTLVIQDEAHHVLKKNKWGKAAALFPNAKGLYPTATPLRADGYGLGRHADGLMDSLILGPSMATLMVNGFLTRYRPICPKNTIDLKNVPISAGGDYSPIKLQAAVHKAKITGDIVGHYLKFARGKLGVTFCVSVAAATEVAQEFRAQGVPAEVISAKTPDLLRYEIMEKFRRREILQLVNVDLLGEGVDVPAIEVVSMARPTQSYAVYVQQFGRALRPAPGKDKAIIIDHVDNIKRHGLPDLTAPIWSLDRRQRTARSLPDDAIPLRTCLNTDCLAAYPAVTRKCPYCSHYTPPGDRSAPEFVDGDLTELDEAALHELRKEIARIDSAPRVPIHVDGIVQKSIVKKHYERQVGQVALRGVIALWAGYLKDQGKEDSEIYRMFYFKFGTDILTAQTFNTKDAGELGEQIQQQLNELGIVKDENALIVRSNLKEDDI